MVVSHDNCMMPCLAGCLYLSVRGLLFFFFKDWVWTIFKIFIEFVTILLLFYVFLFFGPETCEISTARHGSNMHPLNWKAKS